MHIFVSWSGRPAQGLAAFLQVWLRQVIQELDPFMSTTSIAKGSRWSPEIAKRLEETSEAIVCVTSDNQNAPWLNFEAGALAKATDSHVRPLLIDLTPSDVDGPLSEFQLTSATDKEDVRRLLTSINENCDRPLPNEILDVTFDREWPALADKVKDVIGQIGGQSGAKQRKRNDPDILAEMLDRVRAVERLTQENIYLSERLYNEALGISPLRSNLPRRINSLPHPGSDIQLFHDYVRSLSGDQRIKIRDHKQRVFEGRILAFKGEMPDAAILLGDDKQSATTIRMASIESVQLLDDLGKPI